MNAMPITEQKFYEMLGVLPPAAQRHDGFLVGEPTDHDAEGNPRYGAYFQHDNRYYFGGILTIQQFENITIKTDLSE